MQKTDLFYTRYPKYLYTLDISTHASHFEKSRPKHLFSFVLFCVAKQNDLFLQ